MPDRFDKFTNEARQVLTWAQEEAQHLEHGCINSAHMLLAVTRQEAGPTLGLLAAHEIDHDAVQREVIAMVEAGQLGSPNEIGLTPDGKRVIELAVNEARRLDLIGIDTEHLLAGIVKQRDAPGAKVLAAMGVNLDELTSELDALLQGFQRHRPSELGPATGGEVVQLAEENLEYRGRTSFIPDPQARTFAIERLRAAIEACSDREVRPYTKLLIDELLRTDLQELIALLGSEATTLPAFYTGVGQMKHARRMLERFATVFQSADEHGLADATRAAAAALQVANPLF